MSALEMRRTSSSKPSYIMLPVVPTLAASFASSENPNRHATTYTPREEPGEKVFKASLKTGYIDVMLYLSAADNAADSADRLAIFGGATPG